MTDNTIPIILCLILLITIILITLLFIEAVKQKKLNENKAHLLTQRQSKKIARKAINKAINKAFDDEKNLF